VRFIDVSGIGSSGKSAVTDLLREFDNLYVPHFQFEFDLIRAPGGLLDLRHAVLEDWSPVRSHAAVRRFRRLTRTLGTDPRPWQIARLIQSSSQRYARHFGEAYFSIWDDLCDALVVLHYRAEWPFDDFEISGTWRLAKRLLKRAGLRGRFLHDVTLIDGSHFDELARRAMHQLYAQVMGASHIAVVLNNAIEPYNPGSGLDMLGDAKQIVVVRDPRDVFATGQSASSNTASAKLRAFDNDGFNKSFLATDSVAAFCARHSVHWAAMARASSDPRVLRLWFEDLVTDPRRVTAEICDFLELDPAHHTAVGTAFEPTISRKSVGAGKIYPDQRAISEIAERLSDCLYPRW
jgi:hypothetical protein